MSRFDTEGTWFCQLGSSIPHVSTNDLFSTGSPSALLFIAPRSVVVVVVVVVKEVASTLRGIVSNHCLLPSV